jgi:hypothetical protein
MLSAQLPLTSPANTVSVPRLSNERLNYFDQLCNDGVRGCYRNSSLLEALPSDLLDSVRGTSTCVKHALGIVSSILHPKDYNLLP